MSISAFGYAWTTTAPDPLAKLILLAFADGCDEDGFGHFAPAKLAAFCSVTDADVCSALGRLVEAGVLVPPDAGLVLGGYRPPAKGAAYSKRKLSPKLRQTVLDRDGWKCRQCGSEDDLTVDHIHPEVRGGTDDPANLQALCMPCNRRKGFRAYG